MSLKLVSQLPVSFRLVNRIGEILHEILTKNLVLYGGADIVQQLLAGNEEYAITTMYLEFKNLADPADPIVAPAFDRSGTKAYYDALALSPDTDYLRVALSAPPLLSASSAEYVNNRGTYSAVSEGTTGVHGKTFSEASNSAVFGAALVVTPDPSDSTQDQIYARVYTGIDKILKQTGLEIGVRWPTEVL